MTGIASPHARCRHGLLVAAIIATAGLALLAAACGGSKGSHVAQLGSSTTQPASSSGASNAGGSTNSQSNSRMLAYSACMRSHGEPKFPDPNAQGQVKQQLIASGIDVNSPQYQAAETACRSKLPNGGSMTPAQLQQMRTEALRFSRCIRAHGFPNYPDPGSDGREPDPTSVGIDDSSPMSPIAAPTEALPIVRLSRPISTWSGA